MKDTHAGKKETNSPPPQPNPPVESKGKNDTQTKHNVFYQDNLCTQDTTFWIMPYLIA